MENKLKNLGLTDNEIKVYLTILEIGENTVGPIIKKLKIHRQVAYDSLEGLIKKDMVLYTTKNGRKNYKISNPKNILEKIKHNEEIAKSLIPEINKKLIGQKRGQEIKVYEGEKAFRELMFKNDESMPVHSETYALSGAQNQYIKIMEKENFLEKSNKVRVKKNISTKLLFNIDMKKIAENTPRDLKECKFLDQADSPPISIQIWNDSINLISFGSEIFVVEIKNKDFREAYLRYFNLLWKNAKK